MAAAALHEDYHRDQGSQSSVDFRLGDVTGLQRRVKLLQLPAA